MTKYLLRLHLMGLPGSYVERFEFNARGIVVDFTGDREKAARVASREYAEHLAACVPTSRVEEV